MEGYPSGIAQKRILLSPLDWGMGHTTRCVAVIRQLLEQNNEVIVAGNDVQRQFLQREFPTIKTIHLNGYGVTLDASRSTYWQMLHQFRKIKNAMKEEHQALKKMVDELKPDLIISDNRYGFFNPTVKSILITHQLNLQLPMLQNAVNRRLKNWIEQFDSVWVPDRETDPLCGKLVQAQLNIPVVFIGLLNRFQNQTAEKKYDLLGIVSGPEPERSVFANKLNTYLVQQNKRAALVGFSGSHAQVDYYPNPTSVEMENLLAVSEIILSRAGYTTVMELVSLQKKAILIPTPGQFEQEYLASVIDISNLKFVTEAEFFSVTSNE